MAYVRQDKPRFAVSCYEPKQSRICCVLLQAKKNRLDVSYARPNKLRFAVYSYEPKTNPGSLCPAMSQKQTRFAVSCYKPKTNKVRCVLLWAKNYPRFVVTCHEPNTNPCLLCSMRPKTNRGLLCPPTSPKQTQVCCVLL